MPEKIDDVIRVFLTQCPDCNTDVARSNTIENHIVEDIPSFEQNQSRAFKYEIEVQWCPKCKKIITKPFDRQTLAIAVNEILAEQSGTGPQS